MTAHFDGVQKQCEVVKSVGFRGGVHVGDGVALDGACPCVRSVSVLFYQSMRSCTHLRGGECVSQLVGE